MKRIHTDTNGNAEENFKIINADGHYTGRITAVVFFHIFQL